MEYRDEKGDVIATNDFTAADGTVYRDGQPVHLPDPAQLREALHLAFDRKPMPFLPEEGMPDRPAFMVLTGEQAESIIAAARLALAVLERGEEVEMCVKHGLPRADGIEDVCAIAYMPLFDADEDLPCSMVPSLRIPMSALRDIDPNEEE